MTRAGTGNPANSARNQRERMRVHKTSTTIVKLKNALQIDSKSYAQILEQSLEGLQNLKVENERKKVERDVLRQELGLSIPPQCTGHHMTVGPPVLAPPALMFPPGAILSTPQGGLSSSCPGQELLSPIHGFQESAAGLLNPMVSFQPNHTLMAPGQQHQNNQ